MVQEGIDQDPSTDSKPERKESDGGGAAAKEKKSLGRRIKDKLHKK